MGLATLSLIRLIVFIFENEYASIGVIPLVIFVMANLAGFTISYERVPWILRWMYCFFFLFILMYIVIDII